jgi:hypothetical protein
MANHSRDLDPEMQAHLANLSELVGAREEQRRSVYDMFRHKMTPEAVEEGLVAIEEKLGATGNFPEGKLTKADEGEIQFAIAADPGARKVLVDFGQPVAWLGMNPDQARGLADMLREKADAAEGK